MDLLMIMATLAGVGAGVMSSSLDSWIKSLQTPTKRLPPPQFAAVAVAALAPKPTQTPVTPTVLRTTDTYRSLVGLMYREGMYAHQMGFTPVAAVNGAVLAFRVTAYNYAVRNNVISTPNGETIMNRAIVFVGLTGLISDIAVNPYNMTRMRMYSLYSCQSDACRIFRPNTSSRMFTHLAEVYGYRVFLHGIPACIPRGFIASSMQLYTFGLCNDFFEKKNLFNHSDFEKRMASSVIGSAMSCLCAAPFDLTLARLHNQPFYSSGRGLLYNGVVDCVRKTYTQEGIHVFYRGALLMCLKVCPGTAVSLLLWDAMTRNYTPIMDYYIEHMGNIGIV